MSASTPRILQSADEAPCGSLIHRTDVYGTKVHTLRLWNGNGWNLDCGGRLRGTEGWPWGSRANGPCTLIAEGLTEAECRHLSGLSAADAIAWCEHRAVRIVAESMTPADVAETIAWAGEQSTAKPRPQPGDVVPWDEVEDGALYWRKWSEMYCMAMGGEQTMVTGPDDEDILRALNSSASQTASPDRTVGDVGATLVARDLGTDPEAWRKAMREWTANGNRPAPKPAAPARPELLAGTSMPAETLAIVRAAVADIEATAEVSESAAWAKVKTALAEREDAFVRRGYMLDNLRTSLAAAHKERDEARAGWAEQTADAARLRIALQESQQRLVQAHEDIDTLIAKQTAADFEIVALKQDRAWRDVRIYVSSRCPMCDANDWGVSGTVHLPLQDMAPCCVPLVVQTCLTCGNTVFINMVVAGLCEGVE